MNRSNIGLFVEDGIGHMVDAMNGSKINTFQIEASKVVKMSSIIDYELFGEQLYLLREDGLLYSWSQSKEVEENRVQTAFRK